MPFLRRKIGPTAWMQFSGLLRGGAPFLQSVLLSKIWGAAPALAQYETLSMAVNAASFVGLWTVTVYFVPAYAGAQSELERKTVVTLSVLALSLNGMAAAAAVGIYGYCVGAPHAALWGFAIYALTYVSSALTEFYLWSKKKYSLTGVYSLVAYGLTAFAPAWAAFVYDDLTSACVALACASVLRLAFALTTVRKELSAVRGGGWRRHVKLMSAPAFSSLLGGSVSYIDGFLARHRLSESEFLFFRYGGRELPATLILANAVATAGSGFIAAAHRNGNPEIGYRKLKSDSLRLMHVAFPLTAALLLISGPMFEWLYHTDLRPAAKIFDVFLLLVVPRMLFPQSVLAGLGLNRYLLYGSLWEWPAHVALSFALIGPMGVYGPALATVAAYVFGKAVLVFYALRKGVPLHRYTAFKAWAAYSSAVLGLFVLKWFTAP
ncbi:MAG: polysaccharide biosynthesis C-terminal domain-containing protein [Bacteroidia bacterium]|nr:polysaccharide biosynthesis C-terminal domain-containing protein [Bacteroidia bacterium]MDW8333074.1 polysaccharide biosynthesis C-terminal domain-containing protein [Bacteroidia bacterium]